MKRLGFFWLSALWSVMNKMYSEEVDHLVFGCLIAGSVIVHIKVAVVFGVCLIRCHKKVGAESDLVQHHRFLVENLRWSYRWSYLVDWWWSKLRKKVIHAIYLFGRGSISLGVERLGISIINGDDRLILDFCRISGQRRIHRQGEEDEEKVGEECHHGGGDCGNGHVVFLLFSSLWSRWTSIENILGFLSSRTSVSGLLLYTALQVILFQLVLYNGLLSDD